MFATSRLLVLPARVLVSILLVSLAFLAAAPADAAPAVDETPTDTAPETPRAVKKATAGGAKPGKLGIRKQKKTTATQRALAVARKQLGDPYRYGAAGPNAFDCSGLLHFSFRAAGFKKMPRTSGAQASFARRIPRSALRPGDLMFFTGSGGVYHAGIFAGRKNGKIVMLHAPSSGKRVSYAAPWTNSWFAATLRR
ncbi:C40 family peptidase [Nocardioides alcanivorans]|uniref:C40 family peptidase n=1 Tax=Nocardioides alcanivorans TaxID=2897352 RepID=UPI001F2090F0|nr:C40 family peptidase [Nocardioides alcanivorans]